MTHPLRALILGAGLLGLLTILACGGEEKGEAPPTATATFTAGGAIEMGIDTEIAGNTANTLGTRLEPCTRVDVPGASFDDISDYEIDVYLKGNTQAPVAYDAWVVYDLEGINDGCAADGAPETGPQCLNSVDDDGDGRPNDGCSPARGPAESGGQCANGIDDDGDLRVHIAAPGTDALIKMPEAIDFSEALPDSDGQFNAGAIYMSGGPGTAGVGTLVRLGLDIGGAGLVTFSFAKGEYISTPDVRHPVTTVTAQLAVNEDCPR